MRLSNYLFFRTGCESALAFYTQCGLGRVTEITRFGDGAPALANPAMRGLVLHARFEGPGVLFYASDNDDAEPMRGSAHLLMMDDQNRLAALFAKLADGGRITTPLGIQSWGDFYGKLTDRFGVQWMLNCPLLKAQDAAGRAQLSYDAMLDDPRYGSLPCAGASVVGSRGPPAPRTISEMRIGLPGQ